MASSAALPCKKSAALPVGLEAEASMPVCPAIPAGARPGAAEAAGPNGACSLPRRRCRCRCPAVGQQREQPQAPRTGTPGPPGRRHPRARPRRARRRGGHGHGAQPALRRRGAVAGEHPVLGSNPPRGPVPCPRAEPGPFQEGRRGGAPPADARGPARKRLDPAKQACACCAPGGLELHRRLPEELGPLPCHGRDGCPSGHPRGWPQQPAPHRTLNTRRHPGEPKGPRLLP
mmetsp:Transcript_33946/g.80596  ORF Transcript_33946/g.80596 Transcript_33946/m.80596 type:complete len:231 (+) Transcript_33946:116-808(+)